MSLGTKCGSSVRAANEMVLTAAFLQLCWLASSLSMWKHQCKSTFDNLGGRSGIPRVRLSATDERQNTGRKSQSEILKVENV